MQEKKKKKKIEEQRRAVQFHSHAISGSIGRLGENNEVNGSAAPPSSSKEDAPDLRDENPNKGTAPAPTASTTAILDEIVDLDCRSIILSVFLSVRLAVRPILFDTISCLQTLRQQWFCASQSLLCQSTKAKLSTSHHRAPYSSAQAQSQQSQQSLRSLSRPRLLSAACCSLATAPCLASRRLALPCIHSVPGRLVVGHHCPTESQSQEREPGPPPAIREARADRQLTPKPKSKGGILSHARLSLTTLDYRSLFLSYAPL